MDELEPRIHDEANGLDYVLAGVYYIPAIELSEDDDRPIGKWGRMHRAYLEETNPLLLNHLILMGRLHAYLADLNEQAQERYRRIVHQMMEGRELGINQTVPRPACRYSIAAAKSGLAVFSFCKGL